MTQLRITMVSVLVGPPVILKFESPFSPSPRLTASATARLPYFRASSCSLPRLRMFGFVLSIACRLRFSQCSATTSWPAAETCLA